MQRLVIVNTGCANIASVKFAFERIGAQVMVSDDPKTIATADKVVLPGVGAASAAMKSLEQKKLNSVLKTLTQPVLGVCLGMQMMVQSSAESRVGKVDCLSLMPGTVEKLRANGLRLPHMGWNTIEHSDDTLFKDIPQDTYFYFVHSFAVGDYEHTLARCEYGSVFSAAIQHNNFFGVQFHPERSGEAGSHLLTNFLTL
jgi:glutamine amidotransferase